MRLRASFETLVKCVGVGAVKGKQLTHRIVVPSNDTGVFRVDGL